MKMGDWLLVTALLLSKVDCEYEIKPGDKEALAFITRSKKAAEAMDAFTTEHEKALNEELNGKSMDDLFGPSFDKVEESLLNKSKALKSSTTRKNNAFKSFEMNKYFMNNYCKGNDPELEAIFLGMNYLQIFCSVSSRKDSTSFLTRSQNLSFETLSNLVDSTDKDVSIDDFGKDKSSFIQLRAKNDGQCGSYSNAVCHEPAIIAKGFSGKLILAI